MQLFLLLLKRINNPTAAIVLIFGAIISVLVWSNFSTIATLFGYKTKDTVVGELKLSNEQLNTCIATTTSLNETIKILTDNNQRTVEALEKDCKIRIEIASKVNEVQNELREERETIRDRVEPIKDKSELEENSESTQEQLETATFSKEHLDKQSEMNAKAINGLYVSLFGENNQ